jgi:sulfonate transport system substrate-binding protein
VKPVTLNPPSAAISALQNGSIDAYSTGLQVAQGLVQKNQGRVLLTGAGLTRSLNYAVATTAALNDPKKSAAIGDLMRRMAEAQQWAHLHQADYVPYYAEAWHVSTDVAAEMVRQVPLTWVPITMPIEDAQQSVADAFHKLGLVKALDVKNEFDTRYNTIVETATGSKGPTK